MTDAGQATDQAATETATRGEPVAAAFGRLADEHLDRAYGLAFAILRDRSNAQDATHDAFVQAWRKFSTLRDPARFEAWFDRILVNNCRNRLTQGSRQRATDISNEVVATVGDPFDETHNRDVIAAALETLSVDHRVIVALRFERDLTLEDIASRLAIPTGTVQSRLHYALRRLKAVVDDPDRKGADR